MPPRKKSPAPRRRSRKSSSGWLVALLVLSVGGLGVSLWMLHHEKQKSSSDASLTEKALRMAGDHPDAEVFQVDEFPEAVEKKK
jgi:uncharacterized protein HemX